MPPTPAGPRLACHAPGCARLADGSSAGTAGFPLTSILGQIIESSFLAAWWSAWRETEARGTSVPLGDRCLEVGESGVDEGGVVAAQVQRAGDAGVVDVQGAGGVEEVPPEGLAGGVFIPGQLERQQPVQVPGDDGKRGVQVRVERDAAGEGVKVESVDVWRSSTR